MKPTASSYDAIVIGGGHNGLTAAAYLARAGRRVLVLERRHVLGGAAVSEELHPGFTFSVCSYVVSLFRPHIIRELDLPSHGLEIIPLECSYTPQPDGPGLCRWPDPHDTRREIARLSARDAEIYPEFGLAMTRLCRFAKQMIDAPAPDPTSLSPGELLRLARMGGELRGYDEELRYLNLKLMTMSAVDFLDPWFESDVLKAPMSVSGIIGTFLRRPRLRGGDPDRVAGRAGSGPLRAGDGRRARERRRDRGARGDLRGRPAPHLPRSRRRGGAGRRLRAPAAPLQAARQLR
jgi:phytoene dehydrogenase-like protein